MGAGTTGAMGAKAPPIKHNTGFSNPLGNFMLNTVTKLETIRKYGKIIIQGLCKWGFQIYSDFVKIENYCLLFNDCLRDKTFPPPGTRFRGRCTYPFYVIYERKAAICLTKMSVLTVLRLKKFVSLQFSNKNQYLVCTGDWKV